MKLLPQRHACYWILVRAVAPTIRVGGLIELALMLVGAPDGLYQAMHFGLRIIWIRAMQLSDENARMKN